MGRIVILRGGIPTDEMFSLDKQIFGVEINWNITRIQRDADAGKLGLPETVPMFLMPPMGDQQRANIDWPKVGQMAASYGRPGSIVEVPVLQVIFRAPDGVDYRTPVDGNHRICARQILGLSFFKSFVVPLELEASYRVTEEIIDG